MGRHLTLLEIDGTHLLLLELTVFPRFKNAVSQPQLTSFCLYQCCFYSQEQSIGRFREALASSELYDVIIVSISPQVVSSDLQG